MIQRLLPLVKVLWASLLKDLPCPFSHDAFNTPLLLYTCRKPLGAGLSGKVSCAVWVSSLIDDAGPGSLVLCIPERDLGIRRIRAGCYSLAIIKDNVARMPRGKEDP